LTLRDLAAEERQLSAAIAAEVARGKAAGVVVDRALIDMKINGSVNVYLPDNKRNG
jgi:hypothetical protein